MQKDNTFLWSHFYRCGSSMLKSTFNYSQLPGAVLLKRLPEVWQDLFISVLLSLEQNILDIVDG